MFLSAGGSGENKENRGELPTPSSTPTSVRKNRRRSNLFTPSAKGKEKFEEKKPGEVMLSFWSIPSVYSQNMWNAVVTSFVIVVGGR